MKRLIISSREGKTLFDLRVLFDANEMMEKLARLEHSNKTISTSVSLWITHEHLQETRTLIIPGNLAKDCFFQIFDNIVKVSSRSFLKGPPWDWILQSVNKDVLWLFILDLLLLSRAFLRFIRLLHFISKFGAKTTSPDLNSARYGYYLH